MRLHRGVPMLVAALVLAGGSPAYGFIRTTDGGPASPGRSSTSRVVQHRSDDSVGWAIGLGTAGALTLVGTGFAANRRRGRKRNQTPLIPAS
jgi:hypothetical protein